MRGRRKGVRRTGASVKRTGPRRHYHRRSPRKKSLFDLLAVNTDDRVEGVFWLLAKLTCPNPNELVGAIEYMGITDPEIATEAFRIGQMTIARVDEKRPKLSMRELSEDRIHRGGARAGGIDPPESAPFGGDGDEGGRDGDGAPPPAVVPPSVYGWHPHEATVEGLKLAFKLDPVAAMLALKAEAEGSGSRASRILSDRTGKQFTMKPDAIVKIWKRIEAGHPGGTGAPSGKPITINSATTTQLQLMKDNAFRLGHVTIEEFARERIVEWGADFAEKAEELGFTFSPTQVAGIRRWLDSRRTPVPAGAS